jgi:hypothetical protein
MITTNDEQTKLEADRKEAIKLLGSVVQLPPGIFLVDNAKEIVRGADILFNYIKTGQVPPIQPEE